MQTLYDKVTKDYTFIKSFKLYYNNKFKDFISVAGLGIFVAVVGYLGAAIFNDSVVSVAPVFWILLGVGISINSILTPKKKTKLPTKKLSISEN